MSSASWLCAVLTLSSAAGTEDDDSADINFPCYTDGLQSRGFFQHSLSMDLPTLEVSVSLNGDAGDVFADHSVFLASSSRRSCALLVEQSFTHIADRVQFLTVFGTCLIIHAFWLSPWKTTPITHTISSTFVFL